MFIDNPVNEEYKDLLRSLGEDASPGSNEHERIKVKVQLKSTIDIYNKLHNLTESLNGLPGKIGKIVDRLIESNEKLSKANEKHSKRQNWLTFGLVLATVGLIIATLWPR